MKAHTSQLITLNEITSKALADLGETSHRKDQFLMWGVDYYRKYRMDMAREVKTVQLPMTPWKSIVLPNDCVDWIAVGVKVGEAIATFTKKPLASRDDNTQESAPSAPTYTNVDWSGEGIQFFNCTDYGEDPGKMFGQLVKDNGLGYYSVNNNERVSEIQLSASVNAGTKIWLMYLSTLFDPTIESVVHPYAEDMIRFGIHYNNLKHRRRAGDKSISLSDVAQAKQELDDEICLLAERKWDLSTEDIVQAAKDAYRLTPKG